MEKVRRVSLILTLFLSCFVFSFTLFATEINTSDVAPTGTAVEYCEVMFSVGYLGTSFKDDIAVRFKDISIGKEYQFILKAENGYNATEVYKVLANTTYTVELSYPNQDKATIRNSDGSDIKSYHATSTGLNLMWFIEDTLDKEVKIQEGIQIKDDLTENRSKEEVIKRFVEQTSFIENNKNYSIILGNWSNANYRKAYLEIKGNTEEMWDEMSVYQRACYTLITTDPRSKLLGANNNLFASDRNKFIDNLKSRKYTLEKIENGAIVYNAIVEVWDWHWKNWEEEGTFKNPYEKNNDEMENEIEATQDGEIRGKSTKVGTGKTQEVILIEPKPNEPPEEVPVPENFISIFKGSIISISVLICLGIVIFIVHKKNQKANYENYDK